MKKKVLRQHPIKILSYTSKSFWVILIPLVKALVSYQFDFQKWINDAILSIQLIFILLAFAYLRWLLIYFTIDEHSITVNSGVIIRKKESFYFNKVNSFSQEYGFFHRLFRSAIILIDTNSGTKIKSDLRLTLHLRDAITIGELIEHDESIDFPPFSFAPSKRYMFFFSLLYSSTFSGVILISTTIYQGGRIVGKELEERVLKTFNTITEKVALGIPPIAIALSLIILIGWSYSFVSNLLRYWYFTAERRGDKLTIKSGFITKYNRIINVNKINFIDIRRNLLTLIFRISSVHIHCAGYGKSKQELAVLVPVTSSREVFDSMKFLLPAVPIARSDVKPVFKAHRRFILIPFILASVVPLISFTIYTVIPSWSVFIKFLTIIVEIPLIWLFIVKNIAYFTTSIGFDGSFLTLRYCYLFSFHTVLVSKSKISMVSVKQSPFQLKSDSCTIIIYSNSEQTKKHKIKNLPYKKIMSDLSDMCVNIIQQ